MVIFCTSVSVFNFIGRNDVKIALLGKNSIDVIVVSHQFSADIIDISGKKIIAAMYINTSVTVIYQTLIM